MSRQLPSSVESQGRNIVLPLPPIRLQNGEYYQPFTIIKSRTAETEEVVGVVSVELAFIPRACVTWTNFPQTEKAHAYCYFVTTCNCSAKVSQYLINPKWNGKHKLQCGDRIKITKVSLHPQAQGLTRCYACIEEFQLISQSVDVDLGPSRWRWWIYSRDDTQTILETLEQQSFPSPAFYRLNYWFEQCPYIPRHQHDPIGLQLDFNAVSEMVQKFKIGNLTSYLNMSHRILKEAVAVVLAVRKPVNFLSVNQTPLIPVRTVLTVADDTGCCDVVLWNKVAIVGQTDVQIGTMINLKGFKVSHASTNAFTISHPHVPRVPVEIVVEEKNRASDSLISILSNHYQQQFAFPDPFHNFVPLSDAENWKNHQTISVVGVIVGMSRYHSINYVTSHIGRSYVRRWIDLSDLSNDKTVSVCLYVNRSLERHLAFKLNKIVCLTHVLVKRTNFLEKFDFACLNSTANTEIFIVPGPGDDRLPSGIQHKVAALKSKLETHQPPASWIGGTHPFENYLLERSFISELTVKWCWGLNELQCLNDTLSLNHQTDFVFPSRIVQVAICRTSSQASWTINQRASFPILSANEEIVWERPSRFADGTATYGAAIYFENFQLRVDPNSPTAECAERSLRFPSTNILEEMDLMETQYPDGSTMTADVINSVFYRITFEHVQDRVAITCIFDHEHTETAVKLKDLLQLNIRPTRQLWNSPVLSKINKNFVPAELDVAEDEEFKPVIRVQCLQRNRVEFFLCCLAS